MDTELRKDALTMALYVALGLLGALSLFDRSLSGTDVRIVETIWGITIGLVLAHVFAFVVAAHVVGQGSLRRHDGEAAVAHLIGGVAVAVVATVTALIARDETALRAVRLVLAVFIGTVGYLVRRSNGASRTGALLFGIVTVAVALIIANIKVNLSH
ncbi:hypothetical protein [Intrasporangium sp.]|jgi:hypothetical protein|uniref:hypothetical protein n=1 Tax=Intrasporangium sp. TaxID=1925024 RepID=UPI0033654314